MEQSLIAAVSGIQANQTYLDVIGNNVANANTTGYKSENANFVDLLSDQVSGASAPLPNGAGAGINPISVGSGVRVGAVETDQTQGAIQQTNVPTDVAIQGSGYLIAKAYGQTEYTRDGSLTLDANGDLSTQTGGLIQGWMANSAGAIDSNAPTTGITIPEGDTMPARATTQIDMTGNLPAWNGTGTATPVTASINAYDSLGDSVPVTLTYTPVAGTANAWTVQGTVTNPTGTTSNLWTNPPTITFNSTSGQVSGIATGASPQTPVTANSNGSYSVPVGTMPSGYTFPSGDTWSLDFPSPTSSTAVTQFSGNSTITVAGQDGYTSGKLASFSIGSDGVITGAFSNGNTQAIGQIAMASFSNPNGLQDQGNMMYTSTANSGQAQVGTAGSGTRGTFVGGALEGSNVDISTQLTDLIVAQEAYEANTKVISTTATNLQALNSMA